MKKKRWIILISIIVILAGIIVGLYYYSCSETFTQCAQCYDEDCVPCPEPKKYCSFYNIPYRLGLKKTIDEILEEEYKDDYETWKERCEYVNINFRCGTYDCSKKGYKNNYNLCFE